MAPVESAVATSDELYRRKLDDGSVEAYFTGVKLGIQHIRVGDLCAIRSIASTKSVPFDTPYQIGQILTVFHVFRDNARQTKAHIRWMLRFSEAEVYLTQKDIKDFTRTFRPENALLESWQICIIDVERILPALVVLERTRDCLHRDAEPPFDHGNYYQLVFHCPRRINAQQQMHRCSNDWPMRGNLSALIRAWKRHLLEWDRTLQPVVAAMQMQLAEIQKILQQDRFEVNTYQKASEPMKPLINNKKRKSTEETKSKSKQSRQTKVPPIKEKNASKRSNNDRMDLGVAPIGEPFRVRRHRQVSFYTTCELDLDCTCISGPSVPRRWQVCVGETIAVHCDDDDDDTASKQDWSPFTVPWSPGQVLAIYHTKGEYFMQVRWLYVREDLEDTVQLTPLQEKELSARHMVIERDEHVQQVPLEAALGRVLVSSMEKPTKKWLRNFVSSIDKVPQVPRICWYGHCSKDDAEVLHPVRDWDDRVGPLRRGLMCPKGWVGKLKTLRIHYDGFLRGRFNLERSLLDSAAYDTSSPDEIDEAIVTQWPPELLDASDVPLDALKGEIGVSSSKDGVQRRFFQTVDVGLLHKRCDARATAKKSVSASSWSVNVGDVVCLANNSARPPMLHSTGRKNVWYPFVGPWSYAQVLSIYVNDAKVFLEVRLFYRQSDFPANVKTLLPPCAENEEEIYETDDVHRDIPAGRVFGRADVFLGRHTDVCNVVKDESIPSSECRCRYFYFVKHGHFQPLYSSSMTPKGWYVRMLERGLNCSDFISGDISIQEAVELVLDIALVKTTSSVFCGLLTADVEKPKGEKPFLTKTENGQLNKYLLSIAIPPPWSEFVESDMICSEQDRRGLEWLVRVGDIVAIQAEVASNMGPSNWYPFRRCWRPCQILAILKTDIGHSSSSYRLCVRWFYRKSETSIQDAPVSRADSLGVLYQTESISDMSIEATKLLGPLALFGNAYSFSSNEAAWKQIPPYMPFAGFFYGGYYSVLLGTRIEDSSTNVENIFISLLREGIRQLPNFDPEEKRRLFRLVQQELRRAENATSPCQLPISKFMDDEMDQKFGLEPFSPIQSAPIRSHKEDSDANGVGTRTWISTPPVYVDPINGTEYYAQLDVKPPYSNYVTVVSDFSDSNQIWTVSLGDPVLIHYQRCAGRANYLSMVDNKGKYFPLTVPWAVGEVVMISKSLSGRDKIDTSSSDDIQLEIRWFYRINELPGSSDTLRFTEDTCEELLETDLYDSISPSSLLAPVALHSDPCKISMAKTWMGMPVVEFHCQRFWSIIRKSLLPCGSLKGRVQRGRMSSPSLSKNVELKVALDQALGVGTDGNMPTDNEVLLDQPSLVDKSWQQAFQNVMKKFSLTDAAKDVYQDGSALIGREKERNMLRSFLRTAIKGKLDDVKSSIFIAGPPGGGKTACVHATIRELELEQQQHGRLQRFRFVTINGMEMRNPNECYVKLWEKINGTKIRCTHTAAIKKLENYFTPNDDGESDVLVLLLDEIDYLVNKKQNVLYDIFNWAVRSMDTPHPMIVVGVSNTLNLPDRLQPRIQSRMGQLRVLFKAYTEDEIKDILSFKLAQASPHLIVMDPDAVKFAAKKTASRTGDVRRALAICRAAVENVWSANEDSVLAPIVRIKDIQEVTRDSLHSTYARCISMCTTFEALLLIALAALTKSTGRETGGFDVEELLSKMEALANGSGDPEYSPPPNLEELFGMMTRMSSSRMIVLDKPVMGNGVGGPWPRVCSAVDEVTVLSAFRSTRHHALAQKYLAVRSMA